MAKKKSTTTTHAQVAQLHAQLSETENKWKRALADYQNLEKRVAQQQSMYIRMANVGLLDKLLPILDDLERAAAHIQNDGLAMVIKQFVQVLESEGVTPIEARGKAFDPTFMDCVEMVEGDQNIVVEVVQAGYQMGQTVIRPAKVKVGDGKSQDPNAKNQASNNTQDQKNA